MPSFHEKSGEIIATSPKRRLNCGPFGPLFQYSHTDILSSTLAGGVVWLPEKQSISIEMEYKFSQNHPFHTRIG